MSIDHQLAVLSLAALSWTPAAALQSAPPPPPTVLTDVRLPGGAETARVSIVIRDGRIAALLEEGEAVPPGHRRIDGQGALVLPAFFDSFSTAGCETPSPVIDRDRPTSTLANVQIEMREGNRKGIQPTFRAVDVFELAGEELTAYREQGFGLLHSAPSGELLAGVTVVTTLRDAAVRDRVVASELFQSAAFAASGAGYPSTLMGRIAQLRQFFLDARWHAGRLDRHAAGKADRRPPYDRDLEAIGTVLRREQRLLCRADSAKDIRRWLAFARAEEVDIVIGGGGEAWKVAAELAALGVPVLLGLDWGEEVEDPRPEAGPSPEPESPGAEGAEEPPAPKQELKQELKPESETEAAPESGHPWEYVEPLAVRIERRLRWQERRDCALRLHEAGVVFALGTIDGEPGELLDSVRTLVEVGLPEEVAIAALTSVGAEILGLDSRVGRVAVGQEADLALWSESPLEKGARLEWLVIDGEPHGYGAPEEVGGAPAEGVNVSGVWEISYRKDSSPVTTLELDMAADGSIRGTLSYGPAEGELGQFDVSGRLSGSRVILESVIEGSGFSASIRLEAEVEGEEMSGEAIWKYSEGKETDTFTGTRRPTPPEEPTETPEKGEVR